ncbi:hypothetical protein B0H34DRAFT_802558 [Crassisporium funariophilum]|nr:hypothetical protein B0H34DRAFT_802558 [Crassisporium funariophilum]
MVPEKREDLATFVAARPPVLTSRVIVQRLTDYEWSGCSRIVDDQQDFDAARRLYALRLSMANLKSYYAKLTAPHFVPKCIQPRFCPSITSFVGVNGAQVRFIYTKPLEVEPTCVVFLAIREDNNAPVVVAGLAPELVHHKPLGDGYNYVALVVMGYVEGRTLAEGYGGKPLPDDVCRAVCKAFDTLISGGFVFGDLRRTNVMLAEGEGSVEQRIRLVDFG